jgi:hypothetical protein
VEGHYPVWTEVISQKFPAGTEKKPLNTSVGIADIPAEIQTKHLMNISLEFYRFTNLVDGKISWTGTET